MYPELKGKAPGNEREVANTCVEILFATLDTCIFIQDETTLFDENPTVATSKDNLQSDDLFESCESDVQTIIVKNDVKEYVEKVPYDYGKISQIGEIDLYDSNGQSLFDLCESNANERNEGEI